MDNKLYKSIMNDISLSVHKAIKESFGYNKETDEFNWEPDELKKEKVLKDDYKDETKYWYNNDGKNCEYNQFIFSSGLEDCIIAFNKIKKWGESKGITNPKSLYTIMRKNYYRKYTRKYYDVKHNAYYEYTMFFDEYEYYKNKTKENISFESFLNLCTEDINKLTDLHRQDYIEERKKDIERDNYFIRQENQEQLNLYNEVKDDIKYYKDIINNNKLNYIKLCEIQREMYHKYYYEKIKNNKYLHSIYNYIWRLRHKIEENCSNQYQLPGNSSSRDESEELKLYKQLKESNNYIIKEYTSEISRCYNKDTYVFINKDTSKIEYIFREYIDSSD